MFFLLIKCCHSYRKIIFNINKRNCESDKRCFVNFKTTVEWKLNICGNGPAVMVVI